MTKSSMILLSLGMIVLFLGPLIIIGAIKDRKDARRKQKASKQWNKRVCQFDTPAYLYGKTNKFIDTAS